MNPEECLIISNLHRRSIFFEESSKVLRKGGFSNLFIYSTGKHEWGSYKGVGKHIIDEQQHCSYDQGMRKIKDLTDEKSVLRNSKMILLVDNDLFFSNTEELQKFINEFESGGYDFVCHLTDPKLQRKYSGDGIIHPVDDLVINPGKNGIPSPNPHWHSTYCAISRRAWDRIPNQAASHHRKLIAAIYQIGGKFGTRNVVYRDQLCHIGKEWFHVGALMKSYYLIEEGNLDKFDPRKPRDQFTVGYFAAQKRFHGNMSCYPKYLRQPLTALWNLFGGYEKCLQNWDEWTEGSIMQAYYK